MSLFLPLSYTHMHVNTHAFFAYLGIQGLHAQSQYLVNPLLVSCTSRTNRTTLFLLPLQLPCILGASCPLSSTQTTVSFPQVTSHSLCWAAPRQPFIHLSPPRRSLSGLIGIVGPAHITTCRFVAALQYLLNEYTPELLLSAS